MKGCFGPTLAKKNKLLAPSWISNYQSLNAHSEKVFQYHPTVSVLGQDGPLLLLTDASHLTWMLGTK